MVGQFIILIIITIFHLLTCPVERAWRGRARGDQGTAKGLKVSVRKSHWKFGKSRWKSHCKSRRKGRPRCRPSWG